jgi:2-polyprenyl-3-methyl-5-hydroxy-6-metoxy-1,4-benzoquinol methylase
LSGSAEILWSPIERLARLKSRPIRVLDIATGGGDIPISLWRRAQRRGLAIEVAGCDVSPRAIEFARRRAEQSEAKVEFFERDVLAELLPEDYDAIICSLFLHHLADDVAVEMLRRMAAASRHLVEANDLRRTTAGLLLAYAASKTLTRSDVVRVDAPLSVRAAFTIAEAQSLAEKAGLAGATVKPRWPQRFLLCWWRDQCS